MMMYDELIERLREWANSFCGCCKHADKKQKACDDCAAVYGSLWEAANAIEELQKQLREEKVDNVNLTGWLAEEHARAEEAKGKNMKYMLAVANQPRKHILEAINEAETVDLEEGEWIDVWHDFFRSGVQMCSNCKGISVFKTNFCPNCGARMVNNDRKID